MTTEMNKPSVQDDDIEKLKGASDIGSAFAKLFHQYFPRLEKAVKFRMDPRIRQRMDPSDVVQEAYIECARRIEKYLEEPPAPLFLWVRYLVLQRLLQIHRKHLQGKAQDARRDEPMFKGGYPCASSEFIARELVASQTSPSQAFVRKEAQQMVRDALEEMSDNDREILVLRHFEHLSSKDAAFVLNIEHSAARKRYLRALKRLREVFDKIDNDSEQPE